MRELTNIELEAVSGSLAARRRHRICRKRPKKVIKKKLCRRRKLERPAETDA